MCCSEQQHSGGRSALCSATGSSQSRLPETSFLLAAQFIFCFSQARPGPALYQKFPFSPAILPRRLRRGCSKRGQHVEATGGQQPGEASSPLPGRPPALPSPGCTYRLTAGPAAPPRPPRSFVQLKWLLSRGGGSGARAPAGESPRGRAARRGAARLDTTRPGRRPALRRARPAGGGGPAPLPGLC